MNAFISQSETTVIQLQAMLRCHLYLSELLQPWFYFAFMEARSLNNQKQMAIESETIMEDKLSKLIKKGVAEGAFQLPKASDKMIRLNASLIKSMLQDWYLKKGKYQKRRVTVDQYAEALIAMTMNQLQHHNNERISA
ncbi:MAG: hypothetical protein HKP09_09975 [Enterobacterales bacterium]|nr:hypothetical protein [Enterobacterales bacterium]